MCVINNINNTELTQYYILTYTTTPYIGSMADMIGRKKIFVTTAVLIAVGSFGSACAGNSSSFSVYSQLACWRYSLE